MWIGDWIVLGDLIIKDIIYLVNSNRLSTQQDFIQLIDWEEQSHYAAVLLPIIHQVFPLPVQPRCKQDKVGKHPDTIRNEAQPGWH